MKYKLAAFIFHYRLGL